MTEKLLKLIADQGDKGAIVPVSRIADLKDDILELSKGDFHTSFLDRRIDWILDDKADFIPSDTGFKPNSLISIIIPSPKVILQFNHNNKSYDCAVPPTYSNWYSTNDRVLQYLGDYLGAHGFSAKHIFTVPQKMLAVHCGLAQYGRNNICYSNEFGSYMQILTYVSDLPCDSDLWYPVTRMKICEQCTICADSCPTGAIDANRQLVNADKCLTLFNESPDEFPEWINKSFHNSIIGCMKCQDDCPGNTKYKNNVRKGIIFTEEETEEIINHRDNDSYTDSVSIKLRGIDLLKEFLDVLPRNLKALIEE